MINLLSKIITFNKITIIGVFKTENTEKYYVLTAKKTGTKVDVVSKREFDTFEKLNSKIDKKTPVLLVIDGKGVLNKQINYNEEQDVKWLKNVDLKTIYFTSFKTNESTYISFCRKSLINENITPFLDNKYEILDVYLGSFLGALLHNSIDSETFISNELKLDFENKSLQSFSKKSDNESQKYTIGNDLVYSHELPLYGTMLHFFLNLDSIEKSIDSSLNREEIIYKKAFNYLGIGILATFLIALLSSYLFIQYYSSKNMELNTENVYSNKMYQRIVDLENQREEKLKLINQSGTFSKQYLSFYAFELTKSTPSTITLNELNIFPIEKEVRPEKEINFHSESIKIKGETFQENSIDEWLNNIKKMPWIRSFEITSLKKDKNNKTLFEINIKIKNV